MNKHGVADRCLAQFSDHDTEKITFSGVPEIYLQDYLRQGGDWSSQTQISDLSMILQYRFNIRI
jgi:hypothetical protein